MPEQRQISVSQVSPAPLEYKLPSSVELVLKAVNASFVDNGAAGDWLPCVTLISDSGHVIARAVDQSVKVTAGDDAEVSWFPGVKHAGGAAVATHMATIVSLPTFTSGSNLAFNIMDIDTFATDDPANFVQTTPNTWTTPGGNLWAFMRLIPNAVIPETTDGDVFFLVRWVGTEFVASVIPQGLAVGWWPGGGGFEGVTPGSSFRMEIGGTDSHDWIMHTEIFGTY